MLQTPAIRALCATILAIAGCGLCVGTRADSVDELGFRTTGDFAQCARYTIESAMHANHELDAIDGLCVEHCFPIGRAQGLDEPAMRAIMANAVTAIRPPPRYDAYDPRTFKAE